MIVTVLRTFVDAPKGRAKKRFSAGDLVSISKNDFERISSQNKDLLAEGDKRWGEGKCLPCKKKKNTNTKKQ